MVSENILVLDGGLSNQLVAGGHDLSDHLWSARLLRDEPAAIEAAHLAYFRAGADVATTASYQASFEGFARSGLDRARAEELLRRSVELARSAADKSEVDRQLLVAASVGPYGAVLADGSEYRGRYGLSVAELAEFHRPRVRALAAAGPDLLALETIPDVDEARALLSVVGGLGVPVWLSFSARGAHTCAGQPLAEAFALAREVDEVIAVGVNCCEPADVDRAVPLAAEVSGKPVVVYPNSGERWDGSWRGSRTFDPARVSAWLAAGARLVGGCCRVGPEQIAEVARVVRG
ncbi:homocysteine S-methyltransferase [Kutzneria viridogrisea]